MAKRSKSTNDKPVTTAQRLGSVIKSARDLMRKDKGLNGELDRLPQLTWILFLKLLDDVEKLREDEALLAGKKHYKLVIAPPYRWRDWAADDEGMSGEQLIKFIENDQVTLRDGTECPGLFAYLRALQSETGRDRQDVIRQVFQGVSNRMESGALLRDLVNKVNEIHFDNSEEVNILSNLYESMLKEMRDAAGDSGEFYTPRPVVRFMVRMSNPQLGETVHDPACGTAGFLVETYEYLKGQCHKPKDWQTLQRSLSGVEAKSLPYMLAQMNLLLHGVEYPNVERRNSLAVAINTIGVKDQVNLILTNPPFGGEEEATIKRNFDPAMQTAETTLLFIQLILRLLKRKPKPGRAAIVVPNGTLFGDGICARVKEQLLEDYNLHTIVRLPNGVFSPYTSIPTNLLFFDASGPTEEIWYYEVELPAERKTFTKTKPMQDIDFDVCSDWWTDRSETDRAWKYEFGAAYEQAIVEAQPHWDAAQEAEAIANQCAKQVREWESQIQDLNSSLLDEVSAAQKRQIKAQIAALKQKQAESQQEEQRQRSIEKESQAKGDSLYWPIYNLDRKNPNAQDDFEHLPPEQLVADIWQKEQRILEILAEIKDVLNAKSSPTGD